LRQSVQQDRLWVPPAVRPPMPAAYQEHLAQRLAAAALIDLDLARRHVQAVGIKPLPPRRPQHEMLR
jgi:hypothetical protein